MRKTMSLKEDLQDSTGAELPGPSFFEALEAPEAADEKYLFVN